MSQSLAVASKPASATLSERDISQAPSHGDLAVSRFARPDVRDGIDISPDTGVITFKLRDFELSNGVVLPEARVSFCAFATRNGEPVRIADADDLRALIHERSNDIKVGHPALTGNSQMLPPAGRDASQGAGWGQHWMGSLLDTDKDLVFCVDHFGGHATVPGTGSTSGAELRALGLLDAVRFSDGVRAAALAFKSLGATEIHAGIGGSIGGNQAMEWLRQDVLPVRNIIDISGSAAQNGLARDFFAIQRDLLSEAPDYKRLGAELYLNLRSLLESERTNTGAPRLPERYGNQTAFQYLYQSVERELASFTAETPVEDRLQCARRIGFLKFVPPAFYAEKLTRYLSGPYPKTAADKLDGWFQRQGKEFLNRFGADGLRALCNMNVEATRWKPKEVADLLAAKGTNLHAYYVIGDTLFPGESQREFYRSVREHLEQNDPDSRRLFTLEVRDLINGHDNFLTKLFAQVGGRVLRHQLYLGRAA